MFPNCYELKFYMLLQIVIVIKKHYSLASTSLESGLAQRHEGMRKCDFELFWLL